jgi:3-oxoacyl-[acyl-carrier protein] reductase
MIPGYGLLENLRKLRQLLSRIVTQKGASMTQVALITGGANGIGRAVAHRTAAGGITVIVGDYDHAGAEKVSGEVSSAGGRSEALSVDVTVGREVKALVTDVARRHGRIDILANIAGGSFYTKRLEEFTWAEWKEVIDVNLKGTFLMCREVAPIMQKQKSGRIVNTASNYALTGSPTRIPYSAAKAGIIGFGKSLAQELAPYGILVNTVAPGPTDTPRVMAKESAEARRLRWSDIPLGRTAKPDEIAEAFYFLTTPESAWITGQTFHVNGGLVTP